MIWASEVEKKYTVYENWPDILSTFLHEKKSVNNIVLNINTACKLIKRFTGPCRNFPLVPFNLNNFF